MKIEWDKKKNQLNIEKHHIDFEDAWQIFESPMLSKIDNRKDYKKTRFIGLGKLKTMIVVSIYTLRNDNIRLISVRRANRNEREAYKERFQD